MNKRIKSGLAVTEAHIKLCDDNLSRAKADSRNEFVEKAIEFYAGYLNAEQNPNFFDEMFTSAAQLENGAGRAITRHRAVQDVRGAVKAVPPTCHTDEGD